MGWYEFLSGPLVKGRSGLSIPFTDFLFRWIGGESYPASVFPNREPYKEQLPYIWMYGMEEGFIPGQSIKLIVSYQDKRSWLGLRKVKRKIVCFHIFFLATYKDWYAGENKQRLKAMYLSRAEQKKAEEEGRILPEYHIGEKVLQTLHDFTNGTIEYNRIYGDCHTILMCGDLRYFPEDLTYDYRIAIGLHEDMQLPVFERTFNFYEFMVDHTRSVDSLFEQNFKTLHLSRMMNPPNSIFGIPGR